MAKQNFTHYIKRDQPKKRPGKHKKSLNKAEKLQNRNKKYQGQGRGWQPSSNILFSFLESEETWKQ